MNTTEEVAGGLRGRCADMIHEAFESDAQRMWDGVGEMAGSKLDVEKFFDSCSLEQALFVMRKAGAPEKVISVIERLYKAQERFFEMAK